MVGFYTVDFYTVKIYTITFYTVIFYTVAKFLRSFFIRSKFILVKIYTGQNLYRSKFIRSKFILCIVEAYSHCAHCQVVLWRSHVIFEQLQLPPPPPPTPAFLAQTRRTASWTYCSNFCNEGKPEAGRFYFKNWKISPWTQQIQDMTNPGPIRRYVMRQSKNCFRSNG
jgi:hypothetical protein